jgi:rare lipoprotein A
LIISGACAEIPAERRPRYPVEPVFVQQGIASWYGPRFHGRRTASGEVFDQNRLTAAHRTLPLGAIVDVTNVENGRAVEVRINDRGPYVRGRVIDLSRAAAARLGMTRCGLASVRIEVKAGVETVPGSASEGPRRGGAKARPASGGAASASR